MVFNSKVRSTAPCQSSGLLVVTSYGEAQDVNKEAALQTVHFFIHRYLESTVRVPVDHSPPTRVSQWLTDYNEQNLELRRRRSITTHSTAFDSHLSSLYMLLSVSPSRGTIIRQYDLYIVALLGKDSRLCTRLSFISYRPTNVFSFVASLFLKAVLDFSEDGKQ
ncbi:hypothetical protein DL96DRAFT_1685604 [Flagelloscypha sp. PMI_526]|nr:hypothetical protein DL96DRAFT_1685604 [Flagelloscypha sp. PMI_526]